MGWFHLFGSSLPCVFKCFLKSPASEDAQEHWLLLFGLSLLCSFKCAFKWYVTHDVWMKIKSVQRRSTQRGKMNVERGETKVVVGGCVSPHPRQRGRWFDWSHNTRVKTQPVCCPLLLSSMQSTVAESSAPQGRNSRAPGQNYPQHFQAASLQQRCKTQHWTLKRTNVLHSLQVSNQVQVIKLESIWVQMLAAAKHTQKHNFSSSSWLFSDTIWKCHTNRGPDTFGLLTKNTQSCIILESPSFYNALGHSTKEIDEERFIFRTWCLFPESRFYRSSTRCASARHIDLDLGKHMYRYTQSPHRLHWWGNLHSCGFKSPSVLSFWLPQPMFFLAPPLQAGSNG